MYNGKNCWRSPNIAGKENFKIFPVHAMKAYRVSRGIAPLILNLCTRWRLVADFTTRRLYPGKEPWYSLDRMLGWAPGPAWAFWRGENPTRTVQPLLQSLNQQRYSSFLQISESQNFERLSRELCAVRIREWNNLPLTGTIQASPLMSKIF
jgi:hypothetical protein